MRRCRAYRRHVFHYFSLTLRRHTLHAAATRTLLPRCLPCFARFSICRCLRLPFVAAAFDYSRRLFRHAAVTTLLSLYARLLRRCFFAMLPCCRADTLKARFFALMLP